MVPPCAPTVYDERTTNLIQRQIIILTHAQLCKQREQQQALRSMHVTQCNLPYCREMKNVLNHISTCRNTTHCEETHCKPTRSILRHWRNCTDRQCTICEPVRQARDNCAILNISKLSLS